MSRTHFFTAIALVLAVLFGTSSIVFSKQPEPTKRDYDKEFLDKLDPFIARAIKPDSKDSELKKLQKDLCREEALARAKIQAVIDLGYNVEQPATFSKLYKLSATLAEDLMELVETPADKIKCLEMQVDAYKQYERAIQKLVEIGKVDTQELNLARASRIRAEIKLLNFKKGLALKD